jgi:hypothetical protein
MNASVIKTGVKTMIWYSNKLLRTVLDGMYVDAEGIENVKTLSQNSNSRVVLMPIYKSYTDFFI